VAQQRERAGDDEVDGGFVPGHEQQEHHRRELVLREPVAALVHRDEGREQVITGVCPLRGDQLAHVADDAAGRVDVDLGPVYLAVDGDRRPAAERGAVARGYAEQLDDHGDRQREPEALDEVDRPATGAGHGEVVQQAVGDLLHARGHSLHTPGGERGRHEPA
jgi:hypothetical protein